jgi:hypothetical protein
MLLTVLQRAKHICTDRASEVIVQDIPIYEEMILQGFSRRGDMRSRGKVKKPVKIKEKRV